MWGEIDPPAKIQPGSCDRGELSRSDEEHGSLSDNQEALKTSQQQDVSVLQQRVVSVHQEQDVSVQQEQAVSGEVEAMLEVIVASGSQVRSQQKEEAELTPEERRQELLEQYRNRPLVFLERYHTYLKPHHLPSFAHVSSDPRAQHYSQVVERRAAGGSSRTRVRNQRYAALRALQEEGQDFSEDQMRQREPLLYEQYIGRYLTDEEVLARSQEAMMNGAQDGPGAPGGGTGGLAHLLLNSYQERLIQSRLQEQQEREEGAEEEEEEEEEEEKDEENEGSRVQLSCEEKVLLRDEFLSQMHQRFLDGKDKDFNYSEVDENPDYDNLDIVSRDAEEKYFDEDDDEEEEEMTE